MAAASEPLSCFVISPIGDREQTPARYAEAAAVLDLIVRPAERRVNAGRIGRRHLHAVRGDEIFCPGGIRRQVVESIIHDDLIVAVMFEDNVNVYYELGIAETLGRPVILLKKRGYTAPFDVVGDRCVEYPADIHASGPDLDKAIAALAEHMTNLLADHSRSKSPFDLEVIAPLVRTLPHDRFLELSHLQWSKLLGSADEEVWLAGTSLWPSMFDPNFVDFCLPVVIDGIATFRTGGEPCNILDLIEGLYRAGREINILTMDDESELLPALIHVPGRNPDALALKVSDVRDQIARTHRLIRAKMDALSREFAADPRSEQHGVLRLTKVRKRLLTSRVTMTEKRGYVTPIFYTLSVNSGPCFHVAPKSREELKKSAREDRHREVCLYRQVREDLKLHVLENESITLVRGQLETGTEALQRLS